MEEKKLAIVVPVFNNWSYTNNLIQYLDCLTNDHILIIVDNASTDNTSKLVSSDKIIVIRNKTNLFFAKACNQGYDEAKKLGYKNVMFLNNDVKVTDNFKNWTLPLIESAEKGNIVGPTIGCMTDDFNFICESSKKPSKGIWYLSGWNITASVETWEKLLIEGTKGPFSEEYNFYHEDPDLQFRANKLNIPCEVISVPVRHFGKATAKQLGINKLYQHSREIFLKNWKR